MSIQFSDLVVNFFNDTRRQNKRVHGNGGMESYLSNELFFFQNIVYKLQILGN